MPRTKKVTAIEVKEVKEINIPAKSRSNKTESVSKETSKTSSKNAPTKAYPKVEAKKVEAKPKPKEEPKPNTISRVELSQEVAKAVGRMMEITGRDAEAIVTEIFNSMIDALKGGDEIEIRGFGSFRLRTRRARNGRNPKTGEAVKVPGKTVVYFKMGSELREFLKQQKVK